MDLTDFIVVSIMGFVTIGFFVIIVGKAVELFKNDQED